MKYLFNSLYLLILLFSLASRGEEIQTMTFEEGMTLIVYTDHDNTIEDAKQVESNNDKETE